jgi:hypothetical protein
VGDTVIWPVVAVVLLHIGVPLHPLTVKVTCSPGQTTDVLATIVGFVGVSVTSIKVEAAALTQAPIRHCTVYVVRLDGLTMIDAPVSDPVDHW